MSLSPTFKSDPAWYHTEKYFDKGDLIRSLMIDFKDINCIVIEQITGTKIKILTDSGEHIVWSDEYEVIQKLKQK